jgi:uncharacterized protein (TIGR00303 family)
MTSGQPAESILFVHEQANGRALVGRLRGRRPLFVCVLGYTAICEIEGISAAGATAALRRFTAAADAEVVHHGYPRCMPELPINPLGPPSPVVITLAALRLAGLPYRFVNAGLAVEPDVPLVALGSEPGGDIRTGRAVPNAAELFERGRHLGRELAAEADYLVIGESVPGGTTTALALLLALGFDAAGKVSSSAAVNPHALKQELVRAALEAAWPNGTPSSLDPLEAAAAVGDPMQPAVAGLALGALERGPVLLAGGTQMAGVLALMDALELREGRDLPAERVGVATTRWVAADRAADLAGLARQLGQVPFLAANLQFGESRLQGLRRYEQGLVKEGVGAGGAAIAAMLATDVGNDDILCEVEAICDELAVRG